MLPPWTRELVVRYFLTTFPIMEKNMGAFWKNENIATKKSQMATHALRSLRLLEKEWSGEVGMWKR